MKAKFNIFAMACLALVASLASCKKDVDVMGTCENLAMQTLASSASKYHSVVLVDGAKSTLIEYAVLSADKKQMKRTCMQYGSGLELTEDSVLYTYAMSGMNENGVGMKLALTPMTEGAEPRTITFNEGAFFEENGTKVGGDLMSNLAKAANLKTVVEILPNHTFDYGKAAYFVDTVITERIDTTAIRRRENGKWVVDYKYDTVKVSRIDTLLPYPELSYNEKIVITRNDKNENIAQIIKTTMKGERNGATTVLKDSVVDAKEYLWSFSDIIASQRFVVHFVEKNPADSSKPETLDVEFNKYKADKEGVYSFTANEHEYKEIK